MTHPHDELVPYLLGELDAAEARALERHLDACDACRAQLHALGEGMASLVESLPQEAPSEAVWSGIAQRVRAADADGAEGAPPPGTGAPGASAPGADDAARSRQPTGRPGTDRDRPPPAPPRRARGPRWPTWALAASLLLAAGGAWWAGTERAAVERIEQQQTVVARWLARDDVRVHALPMQDGSPLGSVLVLPDGRALLVLAAEPPDDRVFQAWGIRGDDTVSLGVVRERVSEYQMGPFQRFWLSLEPEGGSAEPTDILGATGLG